MRKSNSYVNSGLIKIRDKLSDNVEKVSDDTGDPNRKNDSYEAINRDLAPEMLKALQRRTEDFRLTRREICGKLSEKIASIPEEIRMSERKVEELSDALEKLADMLDDLKDIDDSNWDRGDSQKDLGRSMKKLENARMEYLRINSKISVLHREVHAAESETDRSFSPELNSITFAQAFRLGFIFAMPVIITIVIAAVIIAVAVLLAI